MVPAHPLPKSKGASAELHTPMTAPTAACEQLHITSGVGRKVF